ncbi:MAG: (d)CMP kinase [Duodenibacillus sp.]|nr:(d)CMP kinase [Duodenibacillus sp.]
MTTETSNIPVIAIDGPTASGKGSIASRVAQALGFHYLDSGALFRMTALKCLQAGLDLADEAACGAAALAMDARFEGGRILLDGADVTEDVRREEVGLAASRVAVLPAVRSALLALEHRARRAPGLVADGRDMANVVFPDAGLKVFLTASAEARAKRRHKQLLDKGISANLASLAKDLEERDRRDRERKAAPCLPHPEAIVIDSSGMTVEETVAAVLSHWRKPGR